MVIVGSRAVLLSVLLQLWVEGYTPVPLHGVAAMEFAEPQWQAEAGRKLDKVPFRKEIRESEEQRLHDAGSRGEELRQSDPEAAARERHDSGIWIDKVMPEPLQRQAPHPRAACFDFDLTITKEHTSGSQSVEFLKDPAKVYGNIRDPEYFRYTVRHLVAVGHKVCIATFADASGIPKGRVGGCDLVERYLDVLFGPQRDFLRKDLGDLECWEPKQKWQMLPEDEQVAYLDKHPESIHEEVAKNKNAHLRNIMNRILDVARRVPGNVVLFDDSERNLQEGREEGFHTVEVRDEDSWEDVMSREDVRRLLWLGEGEAPLLPRSEVPTGEGYYTGPWAPPGEESGGAVGMPPISLEDARTPAPQQSVTNKASRPVGSFDMCYFTVGTAEDYGRGRHEPVFRCVDKCEYRSEVVREPAASVKLPFSLWPRTMYRRYRDRKEKARRHRVDNAPKCRASRKESDIVTVRYANGRTGEVDLAEPRPCNECPYIPQSDDNTPMCGMTSTGTDIECDNSSECTWSANTEATKAGRRYPTCTVTGRPKRWYHHLGRLHKRVFRCRKCRSGYLPKQKKQKK